MKTIYYIILIFTFLVADASAQTITSNSTGGNWEDVTTWIGGVVPGENNDVIINGVVSPTNSNAVCRNLTINAGKVIQNGGGYGWLTLHVKGNLINNGSVRNNPNGNAFCIEIWGNVTNNGEWNNWQTFFPAQSTQYISQSSGKYFESEVRYADASGYTFNTGKLTASSDLTFKKKINLNGYIANVGYYNGVLDMANKNLTLTGDAYIHNGTVKNTANLTILENAYLVDITFEGNTTIKGRGRIDNGNVTFKGNITVADTLQNGGGYGWLAVHIDGSLTNNGIIRNNESGNALQVEVWGDVHNNGVWINWQTLFPAKTTQYISQSSGKFFDSEIRYADAGGYTFNSGKLVASSDLTFKKKINLNGYIANVGYYNGVLDMANKNLTLTGDAYIYNGTVKNTANLTILENAYLVDIIFEGNTTLKGRGRIDNSNVHFKGNLIVIDTLQNGGGYGWLTPIIYGELINYGVIKNNISGNWLCLDIRGNAYNYGTWENYETLLKTEGTDRKISGEFKTRLYMYKSGDPQNGSVLIDGKMINNHEIYLKDGIQLVVENGSLLQNNGSIKDNGSVINHGSFTSTHNLEWNDPLNSGLNAAVNLVDRGSLENVCVTNSCYSAHPLMTSSVKNWWRLKGKGDAGGYKITLQYKDELLNGNDESTLEVFLSPDSGKTWKKISTPLNTIRDLDNNTIIVGNNDYPVTAGFGDIVLSSGGVIYIPSISAAIGGRKQIRVGPPNRYTISYWNNSNLPTDKFFIVLNTNQGVHVKSVISKDIQSGELIEIPIDSLTYDGYQDEVILLIQGLEPKEVRNFDIILNAEPGALSKSTLEPITFTAVALWIGGAVLEEYIANTVVEGCYEMWRPVSHDQSLTDASVTALKNSLKKSVTVENGLKGIAEKGAEEIVEKTGRAVAWPVFLAKDILECLGNTVKGMKDYVNGNFDKQGKELVKATSWDPNAKEGPTGFGTNGYMSTAAPMNYTIFFENKKEATAPAWKIVILDTLDENVFDINSVQFGSMSHPMGVTSQTGNILKWEFVEIELPPNVNPPEGEGWVKFTIKPKNNLPTGTQIANRAVIQFDLNPWLATNTFVNTLDFDAPVTTPTSLIRVPGKNEVELIWQGNDGNGAGIKNSLVYMANNDGPFTLAAVVDSGWTRIPVEPYVQYKFYVLSQDNVGNSEKDPVQILEIMTDVEEDNSVPDKFELSQNYPNPFNPHTTIMFDIPEQGRVRLCIFNVLGQEVEVMINEEKNPGTYKAVWNAEHFASGIYFYSLTYKNKNYIRKMLLIK